MGFILALLQLRDYQQKVVSDTYRVIKAGQNRPLINLPVGGGKTVVATKFVQDILSKGKRVLFLAHRRELVTQPRDTFGRYGIQSGIIKAGFEFQPHFPVQIASVQTLVNRLPDIQVPDVIIIDEAHHSTAGTWAQILEFFPHATVIGLSGTPERTDGTGLDETFGTMVNGPQIPWLIEHGHLVEECPAGARTPGQGR